MKLTPRRAEVGERIRTQNATGKVYAVRDTMVLFHIEQHDGAKGAAYHGNYMVITEDKGRNK